MPIDAPCHHVELRHVLSILSRLCMREAGRVKACMATSTHGWSMVIKTRGPVRITKLNGKPQTTHTFTSRRASAGLLWVPLFAYTAQPCETEATSRRRHISSRSECPSDQVDGVFVSRTKNVFGGDLWVSCFF